MIIVVPVISAPNLRLLRVMTLWITLPRLAIGDVQLWPMWVGL
jgi:hypothetical protein